MSNVEALVTSTLAGRLNGGRCIMLRDLSLIVLIAAVFVAPAPAQPAADAAFTFEQVRSYPFPSGLTAAATGARIAWAFNERGLRNIYVAEGYAFAPRPGTTTYR
jgi:hypothetical protein